MPTRKQLKQKKERQLRRAHRTRAKIRKAAYPRLTVFRSNRHIYAQIIDDRIMHTLVGMCDRIVGKQKNKKETAYVFGKMFAEKALQKGIRRIVFDRSHYAYHGRVKAFAEGARAGGLVF